ncbi:MAG: Ig-like domain-containing protein [Bacteroidota bacterium]|nr:Ig-like domain-containing protein [Bacteroidota bacterium]
MNLRNIIPVLFAGLIILISVLSGTGCANIVPPQGGPRDSLPPVLIKVTPPDSSVNFATNRINFSFNEYIDIDNFLQNAIISPIPKSMPQPTRKLNTLSIRLKDSLEPNTTYTINFGKSIKDFNEGNIMKDFTYVFSTGRVIDSLSFAGSVILAETGKTDSTLIVILHKKSEDSAVVKERPRYMAKLDNKGNFVFHNLPAGTFYVYALDDAARTYRYLDNRKLFAFADSPVIVQRDTKPVILYAYAEAKPKPTTSTTGSQGQSATDKRLKFQTSLRSGNKSQDLLQQFSFIFDRPVRQFDSAKVHFSTDSAYIPERGYSWSIDTSKKKITLACSWRENTLYHLILEKDFATDTLNHQLLKADTITFRTMKNSDYGKLMIRFRNLDLTKNPVLQFVQSGEVESSFPLTSTTLSQDLFLPGEYDLRILNDANKNGIWDPGSFFGKHRQPEIAKPIERKLTIKSNWDNEFEIKL